MQKQKYGEPKLKNSYADFNDALSKKRQSRRHGGQQENFYANGN